MSLKIHCTGIRVVGKGSWKEREVGKFLVGKSEVGKFGRSWKDPSEVGKNRAKLERTDWSWKEPSEVGKNRAKLESFIFSWKVSLKLESFAAVGKFWLKLESLNELGKLWRVTRKIYGPGWKYTVLTAENIRSLGWKYTVLGLKYTVGSNIRSLEILNESSRTENIRSLA